MTLYSTMALNIKLCSSVILGPALSIVFISSVQETLQFPMKLKPTGITLESHADGTQISDVFLLSYEENIKAKVLCFYFDSYQCEIQHKADICKKYLCGNCFHFEQHLKGSCSTPHQNLKKLSCAKLKDYNITTVIEEAHTVLTSR